MAGSTQYPHAGDNFTVPQNLKSEGIQTLLENLAAAVNALQSRNGNDSDGFTGTPFRKTVTLTSVLAATPVEILANADIPAGKKAYINGIIAKVNGATNWAGVLTVVIIRDKAGSPVTQISFAKAQLVGNALLLLNSTGVTLSNGVALGTGATAEKGLELVADGAAAGGGSDLVVTVFGVIR